MRHKLTTQTDRQRDDSMMPIMAIILRAAIGFGYQYLFS